MKFYFFPAVLFTCMLLYGCSAPNITTTWKADHLYRVNYDRILVAGVIQSKDTLLRQKMESNVTEELKKLGYQAYSALREYGPAGLANLGEEETFLELCNSGTDAIIVIALIDKTKEEYHHPRKSSSFPVNYYYNRIWNYNKIQAVPDSSSHTPGALYFWECIVFTLITLTPECTIQTRPFKPAEATEKGIEFAHKMVLRMIKEKVLVSQTIQQPETSIPAGY